MNITSRCYYALRALYELADHNDPAPLKIAEIADRQHIPVKFLEVILNQLKGGGFVRSWRGAEGGYRLIRSAEDLTVGEVLRFMDGSIAPVECASQSGSRGCEPEGECPFVEFWCDVRRAISDVVDRTTFADLVRRNRLRQGVYVADWTI
jgi:Rrf2 family protein